MNAAIAELGGKAKGQRQFPVGTVALYGPDDKITTKIVAGVIKEDGAEPILQRWVASVLVNDRKVQREIERFFDKHFTAKTRRTRREPR